VHVQFQPASRVERPPYVWLGVAIEVPTAILAIPVGLSFITDPTGRSMGLPAGWIEATPFGSYLVPGLYLLLVNGVAMLGLAGLSVMGHWTAPWLTGVLGVGMVVWILVQILVMPETMFLTWIFLGVGIVLTGISVAWLRRTGQLRAGSRGEAA
jgi:hypothetical protein